MTYKIFVILIFIISLGSCRDNDKLHIRNLQNNLERFSELAESLLAKYQSDQMIIIFPSKNNRSHNNLRYDSTILDFCSEFDINSIEILRDGVNESADFFISDNNIRYIYSTKGFLETQLFENRRVKIVPIDSVWLYQQVKKEW